MPAPNPETPQPRSPALPNRQFAGLSFVRASAQCATAEEDNLCSVCCLGSNLPLSSVATSDVDQLITAPDSYTDRAEKVKAALRTFQRARGFTAVVWLTQSREQTGALGWQAAVSGPTLEEDCDA